MTEQADRSTVINEDEPHKHILAEFGMLVVCLGCGAAWRPVEYTPERISGPFVACTNCGKAHIIGECKAVFTRPVSAAEDRAPRPRCTTCGEYHWPNEPHYVPEEPEDRAPEPVPQMTSLYKAALAATEPAPSTADPKQPLVDWLKEEGDYRNSPELKNAARVIAERGEQLREWNDRAVQDDGIINRLESVANEWKRRNERAEADLADLKRAVQLAELERARQPR